ncbi:hypothetical protein EMMF5_002785 [Cystobasidiomycetes sp. EMM_F5]
MNMLLDAELANLIEARIAHADTHGLGSPARRSATPSVRRAGSVASSVASPSNNHDSAAASAASTAAAVALGEAWRSISVQATSRERSRSRSHVTSSTASGNGYVNPEHQAALSAAIAAVQAERQASVAASQQSTAADSQPSSLNIENDSALESQRRQASPSASVSYITTAELESRHEAETADQDATPTAESAESSITHRPVQRPTEVATTSTNATITTPLYGYETSRAAPINDGTTALNSAQAHQISQAPPSQASQAQQQIISISDSSDDEDSSGNTASNRIAQNLISPARPASSGVATPPIQLRQGQIHRLEASFVTKARKAIAHSRKPPSDDTESTTKVARSSSGGPTPSADILISCRDPKCAVKISASYQYVGPGSAESASAPAGEGWKITRIMLDHLEFCDPRRAERPSEAYHAASYDYSQLSATNAVSEPSRNLPPMRISNTEGSMPIPPVPNTRLDADDAMDTDDPPFGLRMPGSERRPILDESNSKSRDKGKERAVSPQEETSHSNTAVPSRKGKERAATLSPAVQPIAKRAQYFTDFDLLQATSAALLRDPQILLTSTENSKRDGEAIRIFRIQCPNAEDEDIECKARVQAERPRGSGVTAGNGDMARPWTVTQVMRTHDPECDQLESAHQASLAAVTADDTMHSVMESTLDYSNMSEEEAYRQAVAASISLAIESGQQASTSSSSEQWTTTADLSNATMPLHPESLGQPVLAADRVEPAEAVGQQAQAVEPVVRVVDVDTAQPGPAFSLTSKQHQTKDALVEYAAEALRMQSADLREEYEGQDEQETLLLKCSYCIAAKALGDRGWGIGAHVMAKRDGIGWTHKKHHKTCKHPHLLGADPYHTDTSVSDHASAAPRRELVTPVLSVGTEVAALGDTAILANTLAAPSSTQDSTTSQDVIEATPDPPVQSSTSYGTGTTAPASTSTGSLKPSLGAMSSSDSDSLPPPLVPLETGAYPRAPSIGASFETLPSFLAAIDAHSSQANPEAILTMGKGDADKFRKYCTWPTCTYSFTCEQDSGEFEVTEVQPEHCVECMQAGSSIHIRTPPISAPNTRTGAFSLSTNNSSGTLAQNVFPPVPSASASQPNQADRTSRTEKSRRSTPRVSTLFNAPRVGSVFDAADELERAIKAYSISVHPLGRITASHDATGWTWSCKTSDCRFSFHAAYLSVIEGSVRVDLPSEDAPKVGNLFDDLEALQQRMFEHTERVNPGSSAGLRVTNTNERQRIACSSRESGCQYGVTAEPQLSGVQMGGLKIVKALLVHSDACRQFYSMIYLRNAEVLRPSGSASAEAFLPPNLVASREALATHRMKPQQTHAPLTGSRFDTDEDFKAAVTQHSESVNCGSSLNWKKTATYIRCECKNYHAGCRYEFHAAYYIDKDLGNVRRLSVTDAVISHSTKCEQELMISGKKKMSSRPDERRRLRTRSSAAAFGTSASDADASNADVAPEAAPQPPRKKHKPNSASKSKVAAKAPASGSSGTPISIPKPPSARPAASAGNGDDSDSPVVEVKAESSPLRSLRGSVDPSNYGEPLDTHRDIPAAPVAILMSLGYRTIKDLFNAGIEQDDWYPLMDTLGRAALEYPAGLPTHVGPFDVVQRFLQHRKRYISAYNTLSHLTFDQVERMQRSAKKAFKLRRSRSGGIAHDAFQDTIEMGSNFLGDGPIGL